MRPRLLPRCVVVVQPHVLLGEGGGRPTGGVAMARLVRSCRDEGLELLGARLVHLAAPLDASSQLSLDCPVPAGRVLALLLQARAQPEPEPTPQPSTRPTTPTPRPRLPSKPSV